MDSMNKLKHIPEIGRKYGQWTVISTEIKRHGDINRTAFFRVQCQCGGTGWRNAYSLESGRTKACKSCCKCPNNLSSFILSYYRRIKRRAISSNFPFNITPEYLQTLYENQQGKCALTGLPIEFKEHYLQGSQTSSLDRINSDYGYIVGNLQWVHKDINFMKGLLSQKRFIELCSLVTQKSSETI